MSMVNVMVNVNHIHKVFLTSLSLKGPIPNSKLQTETKTLTLMHLQQTEHNDKKKEALLVSTWFF